MSKRRLINQGYSIHFNICNFELHLLRFSRIELIGNSDNVVVGLIWLVKYAQVLPISKHKQSMLPVLDRAINVRVSLEDFLLSQRESECLYVFNILDPIW